MKSCSNFLVLNPLVGGIYKLTITCMKFLSWSKCSYLKWLIYILSISLDFQKFYEKTDIVQMDNKSCHNMISLPVIQFFEHKM